MHLRKAYNRPMPSLYLVRHAQASFGADDYDRLSALGHEQARWLGEYFGARGIGFGSVWCGTLRRQRETVDGIGEGMKTLGLSLPTAHSRTALDEYDPQRLVSAFEEMRSNRSSDSDPSRPLDQGRALRASTSGSADADIAAKARRAHFRRLRETLLAWAAGEVAPDDHRTFGQFRDEAHAVFEEAWRQPARAASDNVLIVSSGGAIASIIVKHLSMPDTGFVALNLEARNTGVAEFRIGADAAHLVVINAITHLDSPQRRRHITHA